MKTHNGFVSNSSTSSFIILGFETDKSYEELEQYYNDDIMIETEFSDKTIIGIKIARWSDDGDGPDTKLSMVELSEKIKEAKDLGERIGIDGEPQLFAGSVYEENDQ